MFRTRKVELIVLLLLAAVAIGAIAAVSRMGGSEPQEEESEQVVEQPGSMQLVEREDASYEEWLAAGMVLGISMQYTDFTVDGIYLTGETALADGQSSQGAYVLFTAEGEARAIVSTPLEAERTDAGTRDLYTRDLGFATFDEIDPASVDTASCRQVTMEDLETVISQTILPTVYER